MQAFVSVGETMSTAGQFIIFAKTKAAHRDCSKGVESSVFFFPASGSLSCLSCLRGLKGSINFPNNPDLTRHSAGPPWQEENIQGFLLPSTPGLAGKRLLVDPSPNYGGPPWPNQGSNWALIKAPQKPRFGPRTWGGQPCPWGEGGPGRKQAVGWERLSG